MNNLHAKFAVTIGALFVAVVHLAIPTLKIDAVTLGLLVLAVLPWLSGLIKSAELPGGWKIEFHDVKSAGDKVTESPGADELAAATEEPSYIAVAGNDPALALVGLRIEIEKRLRALAHLHGIADTGSLTRVSGQLHQMGVLDLESAAGLGELVNFGNAAAHGASVDPAVANWAIERGPQILATLDMKLA